MSDAAPAQSSPATPVGVDRSQLLPLYFQVKQHLLRDFAQAQVSPGDRVPGDRELCDRFGVSRTVVRQALSELESEGVIERIKGRGTFIAQPRSEEGLFQTLKGLHAAVTARGGQVVSKVLRQEVVLADKKVAEVLALREGDPVVLLERVRSVDGEARVHTITHVPFTLAPDLTRFDLTHRSLYATLEEQYELVPVKATRSLEAANAGKHAAHLGLEPSDAVLVLRSVTYDGLGRPMETFVAYHRGDRSRFAVEITDEGTSVEFVPTSVKKA